MSVNKTVRRYECPNCGGEVIVGVFPETPHIETHMCKNCPFTEVKEVKE